VSHVYFGHISLLSLEKKIILEFAFEVNLSIRRQKYVNAWSDKHINADKCYDNIKFSFRLKLSPATICILKHVKIRAFSPFIDKDTSDLYLQMLKSKIGMSEEKRKKLRAERLIMVDINNCHVVLMSNGITICVIVYYTYTLA
jgi:hypothetical protein